MTGDRRDGDSGGRVWMHFAAANLRCTNIWRWLASGSHPGRTRKRGGGWLVASPCCGGGRSHRSWLRVRAAHVYERREKIAAGEKVIDGRGERRGGDVQEGPAVA